METKSLRILLGTTGKAPYEETAPASVLETFNAAVLGRLLTRNDSFELRPGLIKSWEWDYKEKAYELILRDDIFFHNGRKATAEDLEFTLLRGFFTRYRSFYKLFLNNIEGIEEAERYRQFRSGVVPGIKIMGPYSIRVKLKTPNPTFPYNLTFGYFSLVAKEALQNNLIHWKNVPIGSGPYKVTAQNLAQGHFVLEKARNNNSSMPSRIEIYTKPAPRDYDIVTYADPPASQEKYKIEYSKYPDMVWTVFFVNRNPLGKNPVFHQVMQRGVQRGALLNGMEMFKPAYEMLPNHFWGRANVPDLFDFKKAKELFESLPKNLTKRTWPVPVFSGKTLSSERTLILERLKSQFAGFGLKVEFYPSDEKFLSSKTAAESPIQIAGRVVDYVEPVVMFSSFRDGSPYKYERPSQPDLIFERLYAAANQAQTPEDRVRTVRALSNYFNEVVMAVPIVEMKQKFYVNPKTIQTMGEQVEPLYLLLERVVLK